MRALFASLVFALPALASAAAVDFEVQNKVLAGGKDKPNIVVAANEDCDNVELELKRDDGKAFRFKTGKLRAPQNKRFFLDVPPGRERRFTGTMTITNGTEISSLDVNFVAEVVVPAQLTVPEDKFDVAARSLALVSTRKTSKVVVEATGDRGQPLGTTEVVFDAAPADKPLEVRWKQAEGTLMKLTLQVHDADGFYYGIELFPWHLDIQHEDVNFATGSFKIERAEEFKLNGSLERIAEKIRDHGQWADLKLFVAGHTDTVGAADSNRTLSLNRARAIAAYFRKSGLNIPILFAGFGEDAPEVATPDETDEAKNRRADYILSIEPPLVSRNKRAGTWKKL